MPNRCFYAKHKVEGGILPLQTANVLPVYEEFGIEKGEFEETLRNTTFGSKYLLKRKTLLKEVKEGVTANLRSDADDRGET